ncbi:zinc finger protein 431-like isoform X2 [Coregonus clupeaformis]|nr:zinc finger protein 431-like isoform X2 [Coregonus clupeaformis]
MDQYGRYESSGQPEELFDHSLHWSEVKEEVEECPISAVSLGVETSQVCPKEDSDEQDPSFDTVSDIHGVTEQECGHKGITYLKVKVLPSPVPVKEESEEFSLLPVDEEEVALITVKKEEHEDWLKSEDEDVVKVSVPWEPLKTPSSSCSDTEDSKMESDNVGDCENHERGVSIGVKIEDCRRTSLDPGTAPDTDEKANAVDFSDFEEVSSFYSCPHCAIGFTIERFFLGHLKRDHPKDYIAMLKSGKIKAYKRGSLRVTPATCPQCGKSFTNKYVMQTHQRTHAGKKSHHCADCGKSFVYADGLKRHRWTHTGHKSDHHLMKMDPVDKYGRSESSGQPEELFDHSLHWRQVKEEAKELQISAVPLGVETSQVFQNEDPDEQDPSFDPVSDIHGVTEQECGHKGMTYLKVKDSGNHERDVSIGLKIEDCSRTSLDPGTAPDAADFSDSKGQSTSFYPCPHCTLGFTIERFFHGHLKRAHPEEYITLLKSGEIIATKKKCSQLPPAMCLQCGKSFSNKYVMKTHQRSHTGEKDYHCADCGKNYVYADALKKHKKRCGKGFRRQTQLTSHEMIPTGERPYKCSQCGKGYRTPAHLKAHQKIHTGEKPYQCSQCDKCFVFSRDLKRHRWTHTSERPYKCFDCGKGFIEQTQMTSHEMIHTGESQFKCSQCAKGYRTQSHLTSHEMTHTGERPYKCSQCGKGYRRPAHLKRHQMTHT